jgi:hypothetical protein
MCRRDSSSSTRTVRNSCRPATCRSAFIVGSPSSRHATRRYRSRRAKPAQLLILLPIVRLPLPIDVVIEDLWPEVPRDVGRRRIRNVLTRVRVTCGDLVAICYYGRV